MIYIYTVYESIHPSMIPVGLAGFQASALLWWPFHPGCLEPSSPARQGTPPWPSPGAIWNHWRLGISLGQKTRNNMSLLHNYEHMVFECFWMHFRIFRIVIRNGDDMWSIPWCSRDKGWIIQRDRERERDSADDLWCLQMNNSKVLFQGSKTFRLTICTSQAVLGSMEAIPGARPIRICSP